jgi:hypothetical protein
MDVSESEAVRDALAGDDYVPCGDEAELQCQVEQRLRRHGIAFQSQVALSKRDRVDLLTAGGIAIELKVKGSVSAVAGQLERYAQSDRVQELVLVTTRAVHRQIACVGQIYSKPVRVIHVGAM